MEKYIWSKTYRDGELVYYTKRNFWGKEKVILNKMWEYWRKEDQEKKRSQDKDNNP